MFSSLSSFKELELHDGLNLLLADRLPESSDLQTRNRAGKTSLVEVIHFVLGSNVEQDSIFHSAALAGASFGLEIAGGVSMVIERSTVEPSRIYVRSSNSSWPLPPTGSSERGDYYGLEAFKELMGSLMFGLPLEGETAEGAPSFRSLISYAIRRQRAGGFERPARHFSFQSTGEQQVALTFMFGLDWTIPAAWERVRKQEKALTVLRRALREGALPGPRMTAGELRSRVALLEARAQQNRTALDDFELLPEYHELEIEVAAINREFGELSDGNALDRQLIADLRLSLNDEEAPTIPALKDLYDEAQVVLSEAVLRRYEQVERFHESVVANRQSYLGQEIQAAEVRIAERTTTMEQLDSRRGQVYGVLRTHGALDQLTELQAELGRVEAQLESAREQLATVERLESERTTLDIERSSLRLRLQRDLQEQSDRLQQAIVAFSEAASALYYDGGSLSIEDTQNGPAFKVSMHGDLSKGVTNMEIFALDLSLARLLAQRQTGPGFLVHDSHLFDGVDERQVVAALLLGADWSRRFDFQYLVTLNSDALPPAAESGVLAAAILSSRLTDATEEGGLFGFRFD